MTGSRRLFAFSGYASFPGKAALCGTLLLGATLIYGTPGFAQDASSDCILSKGVYNCKIEALRSAVKSAKTFAARSSPRDRVGASLLQKFGASLGKSLALANQPADLTFVLNSTEAGGVNYGSMDRELATVKVYAGTSPNGAPTLIWVETLSGQPDVPWAQVVRRVLDQLRDRITKG